MDKLDIKDLDEIKDLFENTIATEEELREMIGALLRMVEEKTTVINEGCRIIGQGKQIIEDMEDRSQRAVGLCNELKDIKVDEKLDIGRDSFIRVIEDIIKRLTEDRIPFLTGKEVNP